MNVSPPIRKKARVSVILLLINILVVSVSSEIRQEKEIKGTNIGKEKANISLVKKSIKNPEKPKKLY